MTAEPGGRIATGVGRCWLTEYWPDAWVAAQRKKLLDDLHVDRLVSATDGAWDFLRPDGSLLLSFRPGVLPAWACYRAIPAARKVARWSEKRQAYSGIAGSYFDKVPRVTRFTRDRPQDWLTLLPLLGAMNDAHRLACPRDYSLQARAALRIDPYYLIPHTAATTVTCNRDWQSPVHRDKNNLPGTLSVLTVLEGGGHLVFVKWGIGIDVRRGDVVVGDFAGEYHGNTPIAGTGERLSVVLYCRAGFLAGATRSA